ncbi:2Fe-2S iron-sulfur cluster-binding protein [Mesorhizobium sp.]|uniref:2Fe-2S iron-sulfur cluster-binding protein n=1 Tax=Mesorhizobium sp. TaxID=1871066 RepID=UPI000FE98B2A|nr:2Fe-2S iron-sulfur cluster-binding protein [Mesorhizobium sp.]RWO20078.1 MAG: 2Fe-2S iron-sulfur cluster binding domain-containing protein [Mesorhizobium sp.]
MPQLSIEGWPQPVDTAKRSLLDAALRAGVPYPHGCRTGECGACKSRLIAGEISHGHCDPNALSVDERQAGLILPCRAHAKTDVVLSWKIEGASVSPMRVKARINSIERAAADVVIVRLQPETQFPFKAGQFARLRFDDNPARSYSMANHPQDECLEFHIRLLPGGLISTYVAEKARLGALVEIEGPFGSAYLRDNPQAPLVAIAGGTGLAPIRAIVEHALSIGWEERMQVWAGFRSAEHRYGDSLLDEWRAKGIEVQVCLDETLDARSAAPLHREFADQADLEPGANYYVCGSPGMVEAIKATIVAKGVLPNSVFADAFTTAVAVATPASRPAFGIRSLFNMACEIEAGMRQ